MVRQVVQCLERDEVCLGVVRVVSSVQFVRQRERVCTQSVVTDQTVLIKRIFSGVVLTGQAQVVQVVASTHTVGVLVARTRGILV